jgi:predicted porin
VKKIIIIMTFMSLPLASHAQSSVTLFGLLDAGLTYTSNVGGHSSISEQSGIQAPDLIGVRGIENLGGGYTALFVMDGSYSINTGAQIGGGVFGRESYVGLSSPWGTVTLGNQFDYMYDNLSVARWGNQIPYVSLYQLPDGPYSKLGSPLGTFDYSRIAGGQATPNSVKFTSRTYSGLFALDALYTNTHNTFNGGHVDSYEVGGLYSFAPDIFAYAQYIFSKGNDVLTNNHANQVGLTLDYLLSKRTDVYINGIYQRANGGEDVFAAISGAPGTSSSGTQTVVRVAMRHLF